MHCVCPINQPFKNQEKKMKTYQKPTIRVKSIAGEELMNIGSGSDGNITIPIDNKNPATEPANSKGMLFESTDEEDNGNLYQPWGLE